MNNIGKDLTRGTNMLDDLIEYFSYDDLFSAPANIRLFSEYLDKYGDERKKVGKPKKESVVTDELIIRLKEFYGKQKCKGYNEIIDRLDKEKNIRRLNEKGVATLIEHGRNISTVFYSPINNETALIQLAHEIETIREFELLSREDDDFKRKYFSYGPMNLVFPRARAKEMALYLINHGLYDEDNVLTAMNTIFNNDMDSMERYLSAYERNDVRKKTDPEYYNNALTAITSEPFAMGEIMSSTILEKCSDYDVYDDVQRTILSRGPGFSSKVLEDLGVGREELVENGGKVLKKLFK